MNATDTATNVCYLSLNPFQFHAYSIIYFEFYVVGFLPHNFVRARQQVLLRFCIDYAQYIKSGEFHYEYTLLSNDIHINLQVHSLWST